MAAVSTPLDERARSIFDDIGYTVSRTEDGLRAAHKWREVGVTVLEEDTTIPKSGEMHCFVTQASRAPDLGDRLSRMDISYDWAVIGVRDDGGYDVIRP
ncbi:hypothetical protein BRC96_08885 [Halobacteriales archaeon QS_6_64_34]|nr:MAG: hypothetical protein BRC96_08885 [Halobacteriales archaeon QS_6_64_34]